MNKPLYVISCPFDTYSGYGARARDYVKAVIETGKYEVKLMSQRWGETAWGFCEHHPEWSFLYDHQLPNNKLNEKPDIWTQITIPNEFQPVGRYNIGLTAGIETTSCAPEWIEGLNRMDMNLVSSKHSKDVFEAVKFERKEGDKVVGIIELQKPLHVLIEGANLDIYKPIKSNEIKTIDLSTIKESFAYLFVGHWMQGNYGHDRKNVGVLVKSFLETFKNKKKRPALILKASKGAATYLSRDTILKQINDIKETVNSKDLPNIYLLTGEFSDQEMNELYNHPKVKAMISLTRGEGYGRPLLEFSLTNKPVIASNWSGQIDFLHSEFTYLLPGKLEPVDNSSANNWIRKEAKWFQVDAGTAMKVMADMFGNYNKTKELAKRQGYYARTNFAYENMRDAIDNLLEVNVPDFPKEMALNLPTLQ